MIIGKSAQGTQGWIEERAGVLSASELSDLVTAKFELRTGEMVRSLLARKLAEKWNGPLMGFSSFVTEQGNVLEEQALPWFEFNCDVTIYRTGFLTTDDGTFGCSPDAVFDDTFGEKKGLEVKCYQPVHHVKALLDGEVPKEHLAQIHGGMFVTGYESWQFLAYHRSFPKLLLTVERNETIQKRIREAIEWFQMYFNDGWTQLIERNGGPPPPREPMVFAHEQAQEQFNAH